MSVARSLSCENLSRAALIISDFYGPHITNQILRKTLSPYSDDFVRDQVGSRRGDDDRRSTPRNVSPSLPSTASTEFASKSGMSAFATSIRTLRERLNPTWSDSAWTRALNVPAS
jgi:hypothetical protein